MAEASYERQHLAVHAAGKINSDGNTVFAFGCGMTRLAQGQYALLLDANSGLVNNESFTMVSSTGFFTFVDDVSQVRKDIFTTDGTGSLTDADIEVSLFKSVAQ